MRARRRPRKSDEEVWRDEELDEGGASTRKRAKGNSSTGKGSASSADGEYEIEGEEGHPHVKKKYGFLKVLEVTSLNENVINILKEGSMKNPKRWWAHIEIKALACLFTL